MNIFVTPYNDLDNVSLSNNSKIKLQAMPDTGANKSLLSVDFLVRNKLCYSKSSSIKVAAANNTCLLYTSDAADE